MVRQDVVFRGTKEGVIVTLSSSCNFKVLKEAIEYRLHKSKGFFKNGKVFIDFSNCNIEKIHQEEIKQLIVKDFGVILQDLERDNFKVFNDIYDGRTKFVRSTVRSGQSIEFPGNVVIIGDINGGGQIVACGNIIVMGALRGMVHAGASGNEKAIIAAFSLQATQLRIAGLITRAPDGEKIKPNCPELARIKDGYIIIESYMPNKLIQSI